MKTSEIKTEELSIVSGANKYFFTAATKDISTKIYYGSKQCIFQINEKDSQRSNDQDSNPQSNPIQNDTGNEFEKYSWKLEIKFEDIDEMEINLNESSIILGIRAD
jgi:hypothetical protein